MQGLYVLPIQRGTLIEFPVGDILEMTAKKEAKEATISISPPDSKARWKNTAKAWAPPVGLLALLATILIPLGIHLDNKIAEGQKSVGEITTRLQKVEDAVKVLGSQQSDPTQKLIHDLLATAESTADTKFAAKAIRAAVSLTATLKRQGRPASPDFFQDSVAALNAVGRAHPRPQFLSELINARVALAEYRSSVMPKPVLSPTQQLPTGESVADAINHHGTYLVSKSLPIRTGINLYSDGTAIYSATLPDTDILTIVINPANLRAPSINGLILIGPRQILDGIEWKNVTFVNVHIVYAGGPLMLENVRFVNCTFEIPHNQHGIEVVDYAALSATSLTIG